VVFRKIDPPGRFVALRLHLRKQLVIFW